MDRRKLPPSGLKRYYALYTHLLERLQAGSFIASGSFPSELELVREHRVSRNTVRRALERLEGQGWIARRKGGRTLVCRPAPTPLIRAQVTVDPFGFEVRTRTVSLRTTSCERIATPAHFAALDPGFGAEVLKIERVRIRGREPYALLTYYLPQWLIGNVSRRALGNRALSPYLESLGFVIARGVQLPSAVSATNTAAVALGVEVGAPLLSMRRLVFDSGERLLQYQDYLYHPARCQMRMEVEYVRAGDAGARWVRR